jgi:hypothetical protein
MRAHQGIYRAEDKLHVLYAKRQRHQVVEAS